MLGNESEECDGEISPQVHIFSSGSLLRGDHDEPFASVNSPIEDALRDADASRSGGVTGPNNAGRALSDFTGL